MGVELLTYYPQTPNSKNCFLSLFCWSRGLSSEERNASTRTHNSEPTELEVKTIAWPLWALHDAKSTKGSSTVCLGPLILTTKEILVC